MKTELRCDVHGCERPVIGADIGEAGDYYWCDLHSPHPFDPSEPLDEMARAIGPVLKRLYPSNPDIVLGREARVIAGALIADGWNRISRIGALMDETIVDD